VYQVYRDIWSVTGATNQADHVDAFHHKFYTFIPGVDFAGNLHKTGQKQRRLGNLGTIRPLHFE